MPKPKMVKIKKGDIEGECTRSAVPAWERNGWTVVDDGTSDVRSVEAVPTVDTDTGQNQTEE